MKSERLKDKKNRDELRNRLGEVWSVHKKIELGNKEREWKVFKESLLEWANNEYGHTILSINISGGEVKFRQRY